MPELYQDAAASIDERVADLMNQMTIDEKVAQLGSIWVTNLIVDEKIDEDLVASRVEHGIGQVTRIGASTGLLANQSANLGNAIQRVLVDRTRLGIPMVIHEEGVGGFLSRGATVFPQGLGLAATWNPALLEQVADVIRVQMLAVGARHTLSPVLDIARDPRWGRVEETYGESVELTSRMGVAYVKGVQGDDLRNGVVCTGKHFLGYAMSQGGRNQAPVQLGPRELREVYAEPFGAAIREAGLASIMNSYSSIDGEPVAASRAILTDLLRDELGFDGTVVADYFAVMQLHLNHKTADSMREAGIQSLTAGLDIELPAIDAYKFIPEAVADGSIDISYVDDSVQRVLAQKLQLGLFENPYVDEDAAITVFDTDEQRALAREVATESVVLLKNDGVLPLAPDTGSIAVIGPHADDERLLQGDYHYPAHLEIIYHRIFDDEDVKKGLGVDQLPESGGAFTPGPYFTPHITPLAGLTAALPDTAISYVQGCGDFDLDPSGIPAAVEAAKAADVALVFVGARSGLIPGCTVGEARDATSLDLPGAQQELVEAVAATGTPTVVVIVSGRVHTVEPENDAANAMIWSILPGEEGGNAIADVLTGAANPAGRLPVTMPKNVGQIPLYPESRQRGDRADFYGDYVDSDVQALYWLGHGLSYTSFSYGELTVDAGSTTEPTTVSVDVTNTGDRDGDEVVQLYITDEFGSVARPIRELCGFIRTSIPAGGTATVTFTVDPSRLAFHGLDHALTTEPGEFTFRIGGASFAPEMSEATVTLGGDRAPYERKSIVATQSSVSLR